MRRLLVPKAQILGATARIEDDSFHYISRVLRLCQGDALEIFDGEGGCYDARITELGDTHATLHLGDKRDTPKLPRLTLAQALPKGDKLDYVVQKATELGASRIAPLLLERCVVRLDPERAADRARRWQRIADEAAKQCGRADVPSVDAPASLGDFLASAEKRGEKLALLWEEERDTRLSTWLSANIGAPITFIIGPEGGITKEEVALARSRGAAVLSLGRQVLRTETVGLVVLTLAMHLAGELG